MTDSKVANTVHAKHGLYQGGGTVPVYPYLVTILNNYKSVESLSMQGWALLCRVTHCAGRVFAQYQASSAALR